METIEGTFRIDFETNEITFTKGYATTLSYMCEDVEKEVIEVFEEYAREILKEEIKYRKEENKERN